MQKESRQRQLEISLIQKEVAPNLLETAAMQKVLVLLHLETAHMQKASQKHMAIFLIQKARVQLEKKIPQVDIVLTRKVIPHMHPVKHPIQKVIRHKQLL